MSYLTPPPARHAGRLSPEDLQLMRRFKGAIADLCTSDNYNLVLHKHLGDIVYAIGAKDEFEKIYGARLRFIVRPQHEFLLRIFGISDYSIFDFDLILKKNPSIARRYFNTNSPTANDVDFLENIVFQTLFPSVPIMGEAFICENNVNQFHLYRHYWGYRWSANMGLRENYQFQAPVNYPELSDSAKAAIERISPVNKIILIAPEAATATELPIEFWRSLAVIFQANGYTVIINSKKYTIDGAYSTFELDLSLRDVISLGSKCAYVFSLRSGLCDVLAGCGDRLYAFYPAMLRREMNSLNYSFDLPSPVNEISLFNWKVGQVIWEGQDLGPLLQRQIDHLHRLQKLAILKELFLRRRRHYKRTSSRRLLNDMAGKPRRSFENNLENPPQLAEETRLLGFSIYKRSHVINSDDTVIVRREILNGLIYLKKNGRRSLRIFVLGLPLFTKTLTRYDRIKVLGFTIWSKDRTHGFLSFIFNNISRNYDDVYILRYHIGETYVYLSHIIEWIKKEKSRKPAVIVLSEGHLSLARMFLPNQIDLFHLPLSERDVNYIVDRRMVFGDQRLLSNQRDILQTMVRRLHEVPGTNFYDFILDDMGLDRNSIPARPILTPSTETSLRDKLDAIAFSTQNFILLIPEATTLKSLETEFWDMLCAALNAKGYEIFANCVGTTMAPNGAKSTALSLDEILLLGKLSKGVIGLASGLSILLSAARVPMDLIYTTPVNNECSSTIVKKVYSLKHISRGFEEILREYDASLLSDMELAKSISDNY